MAPRAMVTLMSLLLFHTGHAKCPYEQSMLCKLQANMKPVPLNCIKGYKVQYSDNCHIEAITFYTVANKQVCANLKAEWVRETLEILQYEMLTHI
uniref:Chemokine interleukin-8-like domain-containing protein n=1 Tax=Oreochromis aureus TaxID=47969 RepID=A0A668VJ55_OREAU